MTDLVQDLGFRFTPLRIPQLDARIDIEYWVGAPLSVSEPDKLCAHSPSEPGMTLYYRCEQRSPQQNH